MGNLDYIKKLYKGKNCYSDHMDTDQLSILHIQSNVEGIIESLVSNGKIVFITGNPGDGKTFIIKTLNLSDSIYKETDLNNVGNYHEVAEKVIRCYDEKAPALIAANEYPFLLLQKEIRSMRQDIANDIDQIKESAIIYDNTAVDHGRVVVIDLNNRTLLDKDREIPKQILQRMHDLLITEPNLSASLKKNLDAINSGIVQDRIVDLFNKAGLSNEHHAMRDILGAFSYVLTICDTDEDRDKPYYQALFDGSNELLKAIQMFDPVYLSSPELDEQLWNGDIKTGWLFDIPEVWPSDERFNDDVEKALDLFKSIKRKYYFENTNCCWGYPYHVYRVYEPGGYTLAPYTNSLILNKTVYVPMGTNSTYNQQALAVYQEAMPGYEIVGVNGGSAGWENTDALHCRTRGVMDFNMLFVDHRNVLFGEQAWQDSIPVVSKFIAYSGQNLKQDSLLVYYSIDGGAYQTAHMTATGNPDEYVGYIKGYEGESQIDYYVFGADESGHRYTQPVFADLDPHHFTMEAHQQPVGELIVTPVTLTFEAFPETHTFQIINETNNPVTISSINVQPDDNVLLLSHSGLPTTLQPNQTMEVEVELNALGYKGYNTYTINVVTSVGNRQVTVRVNEEAWDEGLLWMPMQGLAFDENTPMTQTFYLHNSNALRSITVYDVHEDGSNYLDLRTAHDLPYDIPAGEQLAVTVTLSNFPENTTTANIYVSSTEGQVSVPFIRIVGGLGGGGELVVSPETLWFENNTAQTVTISNQTNDAVVLSEFNQPESVFYANVYYNGQPIGTVLPLTLQPDQSITVSIDFIAPPYPGKDYVNSYIDIVSSAGTKRINLIINDALWGGLLYYSDIWIENMGAEQGIVYNYYATPVTIERLYEVGTDYLIVESEETLPVTLPMTAGFEFTVRVREGLKGYTDTQVCVLTNKGRTNIPVHIQEGLLCVTELSAETKLYPNPTTGQFTVEGANVAKVEVYNLVGQKVHEAEGQIVNIDATNWNKGIYLVNIIEQNGAVMTKKLVVK